jgi:hypothetical protein
MEKKGGEAVKLNDVLIAAQGSAAEGATYTFTDAGLTKRTTYFYRLESVAGNGTPVILDVMSATPWGLFWLKQ